MRKRASRGVAPVRAEPDDKAEQVTQLLPGEPVTVHEARDGWSRIETEYAYPGWVRTTWLWAGPEGRWLPEPGGDPLEEARRYLGAPYEWGGMTEKGIDCSGLVHMAFRRCGILVPRDAHQQEAAGREVPEPEPGDLACYPGHIAFWVGEAKILHATGRAGVERVIEEKEPPTLAQSRNRFVRLG